MLKVEIPKSGSYELPLATDGGGLALLDPLTEFAEAAANDDEFTQTRLAPKAEYRLKILSALKEMGPRAGEAWTARLKTPKRTFRIGEKQVRKFGGLVTPPEGDPSVMTVTGELQKVDFAGLTLTLKYPPTSREIECVYSPEIEPRLLERPRGLIQVTGEFVLDENGEPISLTNVTRIEPVDLSPMTFAEFSINGLTLSADPPLILTPDLDEETKQLYIVNDHSIDLLAFAHTREGLADEVASAVIFAWNAYVKALQSDLTPDAQDLASQLRLRFREVP